MLPKTVPCGPRVDSAMAKATLLHHKTWYVSFRRPNEAGVYVRNTQTFENEAGAKTFAAARLDEGCDVLAGTLNPTQPKRVIPQAEIQDWLERN